MLMEVLSNEKTLADDLILIDTHFAEQLCNINKKNNSDTNPLSTSYQFKADGKTLDI